MTGDGNAQVHLLQELESARSRITELTAEVEEHRRSEAKFRLAAESLPTAIAMVDEQGKIVLVNAQTERLFGYSRDEMLGQPVELLVPERFRDKHPGYRNGFFAKPEVRSMGMGRDLFGKRKNGSEFPVEIGLNPIRTPQGNFVLSAIVDITERKHTEEARARLAAIVASAEDAIISKSLDGTITSWNAGAMRLFGYGEEEIVGQSITRLIPPARQNEELQILSRLSRGEHVQHLETQRLHRDGRLIEVSVSVSPIRSGTGAIIGAAKIVRDIAERRRAEERFHAVIENMTEGIIICELNGQIIHWNRAALDLHGFSNSEEWSRRLAEFTNYFELSTLDGLTVELEHWPLSRLLRGEPLRNHEMRVRRRDWEKHRVFSYGGDIVVDSAGKRAAFLTVFDVTERKQAEEALRQTHEDLERRVTERTAELAAANKELEAFSYSVSHDLRAPLRAIDGFSRILQREHEKALPPDAQEFLRDIRANTQQMGQLVDNLLEFSRLGRQPLKSQPVVPERIVRQCLEELQTEQTGRRLKITVGDLPECSGDPGLLKQVWINLVSNALKYSSQRETAVIEISSRQGDDPGRTTYFVKDNGAGFDMRYAHKLFGVFQRLHRTEEYSGTGVGLAIVQRIVQRHGGRIWAEAKPDQGATFFFTLPCTEPNDE